VWTYYVYIECILLGNVRDKHLITFLCAPSSWYAGQSNHCRAGSSLPQPESVKDSKNEVKSVGFGSGIDRIPRTTRGMTGGRQCVRLFRIGCVSEPNFNLRGAYQDRPGRSEWLEVVGPCMARSGQTRELVPQHGNTSDVCTVSIKFVAVEEW